MRWCSFVPFISIYHGPTELLAQHLKRCPACHTAAVLVAGIALRPDAPTSSCPEGATLAALHMGELTPSETLEVSGHLLDCGHCFRIISSMHECATETDPADALVRADREIDAYTLAKEIAEWLCTEKYPEQKGRVDTAFDDAYDALTESWSHASSEAPHMVLAFEGEGLQPAGVIIALASIASRLRTTSPNLNAGSSRFLVEGEILKRRGVDGGMIAATAEALQAIEQKGGGSLP